jgi:hypothetical protein
MVAGSTLKRRARAREERKKVSSGFSRVAWSSRRRFGESRPSKRAILFSMAVRVGMRGLLPQRRGLVREFRDDT